MLRLEPAADEHSPNRVLNRNAGREVPSCTHVSSFVPRYVSPHTKICDAGPLLLRLAFTAASFSYSTTLVASSGIVLCLSAIATAY